MNEIYAENGSRKSYTVQEDWYYLFGPDTKKNMVGYVRGYLNFNLDIILWK